MSSWFGRPSAACTNFRCGGDLLGQTGGCGEHPEGVETLRRHVVNLLRPRLRA